MSKAIEHIVRPMQATEHGFVYAAWKGSFRHSPHNASLAKGTYFLRVNKDVDQIMARPGTDVLVAQDAEDPSFLYGFIVYEVVDDTFCGHFTYVRHGFRRQGIAQSLLGSALQRAGDVSELKYTHHTRFDAEVESLNFGFVGLGIWLKGASK